MLAARLHEDLVHLGSVSCRGGRDPIRARQRFEAALREFTPAGIGLAPQALLFVRRIAPATPLGTGDRHRPFADAVRIELGNRLRNASRPWLLGASATAEAVLFIDEAELASCLVSDWLQGWSDRWWWREVLGNLSVDEWLRRRVFERAEVLAAITELLASIGIATAWYARIPAGLLRRARLGFEARFGIRARLTEPGPVDSCPGDQAPDNAATDDHGDSEAGIADVAQLFWRVPEIRAGDLDVEQRELLAVALATRRDLVWARSSAFARALVTVRTPGTLDRAKTLDAVRSDATAPTSGAIFQRVPDEIHLTGLPEEPAASVRADQRFIANPSRAGISSRAEDSEVDGVPPEVASSGPASSRRIESLRSMGTAASAGEQPGRARESPVLPPVMTEAAEAATTPVAQPSSPGWDITRPGSSERQAKALDTKFGGIFYLLNVALALGLYGDFTQPRLKGLELSPWDWLAAIGRRWFGEEFRKDPVWKVLAQLAGHAPRRRPERGFKPPDGTTVHHWFDTMSTRLVARLMQALGCDDPAAVPDRVCRSSAHIYMSACDVDVHLSLDDLPVALRIAGLDRDPGWIPAAGRSIRFCFE